MSGYDRAVMIAADHLQVALDLPPEEAKVLAKALFRLVDQSRCAAAE